MKRLDKFILQSFIGPFILTFLVVVFILLMQHMLKYFDDIIGKGLDWATIGQLLFYFGIFMMPIAMPLAVLLASLITFGNLGEHFELTAIKASGVSLTRILRPIFFFVLFLTSIAFYTNNYLVPNAALEAYSLMYDIKQKKPALEIREGIFYNGIPDVSIKVNEKFTEDDDALKGVIIYDHRKNDGNKQVTVADSGRMSTFNNEQYLKLELFNGYFYDEGSSTERDMTGQSKKNEAPQETLSRTKFSRLQVVFDLSSFALSRTDQRWFQSDRMMRNMGELQSDIDSVNGLVLGQRLSYYKSRPTFFVYYQRHDTIALPEELVLFDLYKDSLAKIENAKLEATAIAATTDSASALEIKAKKNQLTFNKFKSNPKAVSSARKNRTFKPKVVQPLASNDSTKLNIDSLLNIPLTRDHVQAAANYARQTKNQITSSKDYEDNYVKGRTVFEVQWHKILSNSLACIVMFLIGAPLGAIIKRGGLGVPFLVSILFFIVFYLLTMQGEKWAKNGAISAWSGVWAADFILLWIGLFFLRQARVDARLFENDFYMVVLDKLKTKFSKKN
ncbi:YjgP/YjgQ family permease [Chryseotalea sanaruensis]|uniref:YjgP/YjgQ family permease n=1 Tax=Chryseotalea sanaruensis TaxID=2482724 RepID=A0A401UE17_9BACT|nr:LptF/LptG family permease [Chryseotalea sanaruensis]GCC53123.1 YjgP/YjgQ family permease [Chryseotalea sanaruensis]